MSRLSSPSRRIILVSSCLGVAASVGALVAVPLVLQIGPLAQEASSSSGPSTTASPSRRRRTHKAVAKVFADKQSQPDNEPSKNDGGAPAPSQPVPSKASGLDVTAQLVSAGAGTCAQQINGFAAFAMRGVASYRAVSAWSTSEIDRRAVTVAIGQKYQDATVPYGLTRVIASPNASGKCDAFMSQVVPSPMPCAKVRDIIAQHGRQMGDLEGIALMEDGPNHQTMLIPTSGNACVLVSQSNFYSK